MAVYDTNVVINCLDGDERACKLMETDSECVIPPTVASEVRSGLHKVPPNCKVYTYQEEPFNDPSVAVEPARFAAAIREVFFSKRKRGRRKEWEVSGKTKRWFQSLCTEWKNGRIDENDWRIVKEANVLAELGYIDDKRLISNDSHITHDFCKAAYKYVMERLDQIVGGEPEEMEVEIIPYEKAIRTVVHPPTIP